MFSMGYPGQEQQDYGSGINGTGSIQEKRKKAVILYRTEAN